MSSRARTRLARAAFGLAAPAATQPPANPTLPFARRADDVVARVTKGR